MNILMLPRYDQLGASSRLRLFQYIPALEKLGIKVYQSEFFDGSYVRRLYAGHGFKSSVGRAYLRRLGSLWGIRDVQLIWIEKEVLPWVPWLIERGLLPRGIPIVTDYDDAVFHRYDQHSHLIVRTLLGRKIDHIMAASDLVMAGNDYLANRAHAAGARRVEIIPTVVNTQAYHVRPKAAGDMARRIGWIGTPGTWTDYMAPMMPLLLDIAAAHDARLVAVGAGKAVQPHSLLDNLTWSEETEVSCIQEMDIGIMPLVDTPWSRGKCGYKLIQYMACGLPVVASPVGVNAKIVEHGVNGFLASTEAQWREALNTLLHDSDLRQRMGAAGRRKVETEYSLQVYGQRVVNLLLEIARKGRAHDMSRMAASEQ